MKKGLLVGLVAGIIIAAGIVLMVKGNGQMKQNSPQDNPIVKNDLSAIPGDAELADNMKAAGLDILNTEGTVQHIHQHLDLMVNNQAVTVPAEIGIGTDFISPIHTHDTTGIIHVESPVVKDFTLQEFFKEWGIDFSDKCIGTNCADDSHKLIVAVNGSPVDASKDIVLKSHDEIEVWYGDKNINPDLIKSYSFPQGY